MRIIDIIAMVLLIIGGLNWGLIGVANFNLVDAIFGSLPILEKIIYVLVGLAAIWKIVRWSTHAYCCPYHHKDTE